MHDTYLTRNLALYSRRANNKHHQVLQRGNLASIIAAVGPINLVQQFSKGHVEAEPRRLSPATKPPDQTLEGPVNLGYRFLALR